MIRVAKRAGSDEFSLAKQASSRRVEAFESSGRTQAAKTSAG